MPRRDSPAQAAPAAAATTVRVAASAVSKAPRTRANGKKKGRPSDYDPRYVATALQLCTLGATTEELAVALATSTVTIAAWMNAHPAFLNAINKGRDAFDSGRIKTAMRDRALGYNWEERSEETTEIEVPRMVKLKDGTIVEMRDDKGRKILVRVPAVKTKVTNRHVPAEPVCMFFWLTNRQRDQWQHIRVNKVEGKLDGPAPTVNNYFDLKNLPEKDLANLESILAKARADKAAAAADAGPSGTA